MQTRTVKLTTATIFTLRDKYGKVITTYTGAAPAIELPLSKVTRCEYYTSDSIGIVHGILPDGEGNFEPADMDKDLSDSELDRFCYRLGDMADTIQVDTGFLARLDTWFANQKQFTSEDSRAFTKLCEILNKNETDTYIKSTIVDAIDKALGVIIEENILEMESLK